ncbi:Protein disulfide-isomerase 2 (PDI 1) (Prolyl 4-hydroxylase subunit beta-2) [Durusdinium trenchii]|uniref:Protein disulfide-isomerase n=1 Tax=Durusdinium trenchii TaxID=1381693 RepID=A0ABP0QFD9_9DINO
MKWVSAAVLAAVATLAQAEHVVHLGDSDFDDHVAKHKYVLLEAYAPWCGHCKQLAPEYEKAAEHFAGVEVEGGLSLVAVDATEHKEIASRFGVQGFPTLKWIVNGEASDYGGGRQKDDIVAWINKKTGPPAKDLADAAALEAFKEQADVVVVGYFSAADSDAAKAFLAVAETDEDAQYGISTSDEVKTAAGLSGDGVVLFRQFEEPDAPRVECEGELTKESIKQCVSSNLLPLVVPFSQQNAPKIFGGSIKQHCLVFIESATADAATLAKVRPVAEQFSGEYLFVSVSKEDDRILEFFGIQEGDLPTARIVVMGDEGMKKFALKEAGVETDALTSFITDHKEGKLSQDLKSEEVDEEADFAGPVKVLKGKNHDEFVMDPTKNVLVKMYAPWCGHCKKMAPDYEKLGEHFADDEDVVIAKIDSTANECESVQVQGFPTLKFYPKGENKEMMDFDGSRDFDGMKKFIEENKL